ncbi:MULTISPECIES: hypothetical protein [unclassified Streptomyces]
MGELQFLLVTGEEAEAATLSRRLAPAYEALRTAPSARAPARGAGAARP